MRDHNPRRQFRSPSAGGLFHFKPSPQSVGTLRHALGLLAEIEYRANSAESYGIRSSKGSVGKIKTIEA